MATNLAVHAQRRVLCYPCNVFPGILSITIVLQRLQAAGRYQKVFVQFKRKPRRRRLVLVVATIGQWGRRTVTSDVDRLDWHPTTRGGNDRVQVTWAEPGQPRTG